jgi:murein DD-endopeptidase MepM/ murein hydrolase activator NlpD
MDPQVLLNRPKPTSTITPSITKINSLALVSEQTRKSSERLKKIFETRTYQKKTQLTVLDRYKSKLDLINKQNEKKFLKKKKSSIKTPEVKKYVGSFFSPGGDILKSLAALSALKSFEKGSKGDWGGALKSGLVTAGALGLPLMLGMMGARKGGGGTPGAPSPSGGRLVGGTPYSQTRAGQSYAGMQAQKNLPKWAQRAAGGSASRFAASNERMFQGTANIGDRSRLLSRRFGFGGVGGMAENIATRGGGKAAGNVGARAGGTAAAKAAGVGARAVPLLGTALNVGLSAYRFSQGDVVGGILSAVSAIPIIGWAALGVDLAREFGAFDGTFLGRKDALKKQTKEQKKLVEDKKKKKSSELTFGKTLDRYEKVVNKFSEFVKVFKTPQEVRDMYEGGSSNPPPTPTDPYTGPIDSNAFFPLPGGILSTKAVGVPGGEYGAERNYGGHSGQDIGGLPPGSSVVAWKTGKVSYSGSVESGDTIITIDHGGGIQSVYKHVVPTVPAGSTVYGGQQVATLFNTKSYQPHLHFEVWRNGRHSNPNPDISASQRIPSPLTVDRAKQNYESLNRTSQPSQTPRFRGSTADQLRAIGQTQAASQSEAQFNAVSQDIIHEIVDVLPPPKTNSYLQPFKKVLNVPMPIINNVQQVGQSSSESGSEMFMSFSEESLLNTYYKQILLNTLQS